MNSNERDPVSAATLSIPVTPSTDSLERLLSAHYRRVLLAAYRVTGNMADAEDVAQGVFLRLRSQDEAALRNEASYLYRAAINGALDLLRRQRNAGADPIEAAAELQTFRPGDSPEASSSNRELRQLLRRAISELPPRAAEMFTLRYLEELGNREIAQLMSTSQAVVAVTLHHARSRLKKRLKELERGIR
jgi:RNA polymerase sigma factor (sigma-70 family)